MKATCFTCHRCANKQQSNNRSESGVHEYVIVKTEEGEQLTFCKGCATELGITKQLGVDPATIVSPTPRRRYVEKAV